MLYYKKYSIVILLLFVLNDALVIAQLPFYDNLKYLAILIT